MKLLAAKPFAQVGCELGEGLQLFPSGEMRFVDIPQGRVYRLEESKALLELELSHEVSKSLPTTFGQMVLGRKSVLFFDELGKKLGEIALEMQGDNLRCSDGCVLPDGSVVLGIVDRDLKTNAGLLIRIDGKGQIHEVCGGATIPNGVAVMPDGQRVIWVDSPTQQLVEFSIKPDGALSQPRPYFEIPKDLGVPDGLTVDSDGGIWIAMWGGGKVVRVSSELVIDVLVEVGCKNVTSCAFDHRGNLLITTAKAALSEAEAKMPGAGDIWIVQASELDVSGLETYAAKVRHS